MTIAEKVEFKKMRDQIVALRKLTTIMKKALINANTAIQTIVDSDEDRISDVDRMIKLQQCDKTAAECEQEIQDWLRDSISSEIGFG